MTVGRQNRPCFTPHRTGDGVSFGQSTALPRKELFNFTIFNRVKANHSEASLGRKTLERLLKASVNFLQLLIHLHANRLETPGCQVFAVIAPHTTSSQHLMNQGGKLGGGLECGLAL